MCGIFGYYDQQYKQLDYCTLLEMGRALSHRGPDDSGIFVGNGVGLGNQRLSIIDVEGGHQPFVSDDDSVVVVQNGEIYNHIELAKELEGTAFECKTHSDTEVLLRLYMKHGIDFVSKLNGMFSFAIYDRFQDSLFIVRDRIGVKPLFFKKTGSTYKFSSEIKSIIIGDENVSVDTEALHHFFTFNYVPKPFTMFRGVQHVEPGTWIKISRSGIETQRWWNLSDIEPIEQDESAWIEEFNWILEDAVRVRLRADVPFGAFLSGGVDSSSVVALMAKHMAEPVRTFSIGFHDPKYDETEFATAAAKRFGATHTTERVSVNLLDLWPRATYYCDQPHGDVSFLPMFRVSELAARQVKMVLTGDGGDELFAGYDKYLDFFAKHDDMLDDINFRKKYYKNISLFSDGEKYSIYNNSFTPKSDPFKLTEKLFDDVPHWDRINQALYIDMQLLLSGNNLVKPDRMGMANSLEARTPFLDYRMMEFAFRMPGKLKLTRGTTKYLFKKAVTPLIGEDLAYRKKQMFTVPIGQWFRNDMKDYCRNILGPDSYFRSTGILSSGVEAVLEDHITGRKNNTREIRALIALEHWANEFGLKK